MGSSLQMGQGARLDCFGKPAPNPRSERGNPVLVREALKATRKGQGGFADHLFAQVGFANRAQEVVTFDAKFARNAKVRRIK
jgi:hypothetical protein